MGLVGDLGLRPVKGPGFTAGRATAINASGGIEAAFGNPSDCVFVDGTSGPCGGAGLVFTDGEVPGGVVDGTNGTFTLASMPIASGLSGHQVLGIGKMIGATNYPP